MVERDEPWAEGTPCWIDLTTSDIDGARAFYGELFGWHSEPGAPEYGGYTMGVIDGRPVAGFTPPPPGQERPTAWNTYLATPDADATAAKIEANGGQLIMPVMDVGDVGRMGVGTDPTGGIVAFWQAGTHVGFGLANVPGTDVWNECMTTDYAAVVPFYAAVFGVTTTDMGGEGFQYSSMDLDGRPVGGIGAVDEGGQPGWRTYFAVTDTDATVAETKRLGGSVVTEASDTPFGRMAHLADPQGGRFSVMQYAGDAG